MTGPVAAAPSGDPLPPGTTTAPPPPPPRGPGVRPPFVGPPVEKRPGPVVAGILIAGLVAVLCLVGSVVGGREVFVRAAEESNERAQEVVTRFLGAWRDEDYAAAHELICEAWSRQSSVEELAAELEAQGRLVDFEVFEPDVYEIFEVSADLHYADGTTERVVFAVGAEPDGDGFEWRVC